MKLTFLGTGTSCGVPTIGCQCHTCTSPDSHDKRLRCSALVETEQTRLLIDCGPDFREQIMPHPFRRIDGILITHAHYDHMGGLDDVRPYCQFGEINVYADPIARKGMLEMLPYCFAEHRYPGVPAIQLHEILPHEPFQIGDFRITPFQVMHHDLPILGYRIEAGQSTLVYITDMKTIACARYRITLIKHSTRPFISHNISTHPTLGSFIRATTCLVTMTSTNYCPQISKWRTMAKSLSFDIKSFSDNKQNLFLQNVVSFGEKGRFSDSKSMFLWL